jgi:oligopeptide/dipeptide ABC transporter ATP-binding protein
MAPVLEIENLSTHIKLTSSVVQAVGNIDMRIDAGETLGVVGESGCGKSMTGLSIMGLLPPGGSIVGGSIKLEGRELVGLKQEQLRQVRGNEIAMIFQDPLSSLDPTKTIGYQVAEPVRLHRGASKAEALERAVEVLNLVGLPRPKERLSDYPHQLSGGLRQRVMIAMALANEPKLLIADEPTTALDVTIQAQILALLRDLKERLGMAMLLITHDMGVIAGHADRVNVMYAGRVVETAEVRPLFLEMHHPYTQALLASIPQLDQDANKALHAIPGLPPDLAHPPAGCRFAARCSRATDKCRAEEPSLSGKTYEHRYSCWHPVDGPLALAVIGEDGPDVVSTGLVSSDAQSVAEASLRPDKAGYTPELVADAPLPDAATADGDAAPAAAAAQEAREARDARAIVVAAGLEVTADGRLQVSARTVEVAVETADGVAPLLQITNLVKEFPITSGVMQRKVGSVHAVSDVTFSVPAGTTFGLVGESGCGKTTIGKLIVALEKPNSGTITLGDMDVSSLHGGELRRKRRDLQLMFQDPQSSLDPRMRVGAIISEPLAVQHLGSRRAQQDRAAAERGGALPARVFRRPAAAHRAGPGADPEPQADRGRRAGERARRVDPGAGAEPDEAAAGLARTDLRGDLARPGGGQVHGRADRRHVPGQAGRARLRAGYLRAGRASVHGRPDRHHPGAQAGAGAGQEGRGHPRRAAQPGEPAVGVQVPHQVPVRAGDLCR